MSAWHKLEKFLATDPQDIGCDETVAILHVYVDLLAAGIDPASRYPGVAAHLSACGPCADDAEGLLATVRDHEAQTRGHTRPSG